MSRHLLHLLAALCCLILSASAVNAGRAARVPDLETAPEWSRLADLWQRMLDHSSDVIYSPARFKELVTDIDAIDVDFAALTKRGMIADDTSAGLRRLFHSRYEYIQDHHYTTQSHITMTGIDAAAVTAHWIVEMQLAALRRAGGNPEEMRSVRKGAESALAYELSFLGEFEGFQTEVEKRRRALADRQARGEDVDFRPFENEREGKILALLNAYHGKRIRISRPVQGLLPYLVSLTTMHAAPPAETSASTPSGL